MVKVKEDLTGKVFGKWFVIKQVEDGKNRSARYLCQCSCQYKTKRIVLARSLKNGSSQSCGCAQKTKLIGQKFGNLTVIGRKEDSKRRDIIWDCVCDCGNQVFCTTTELIIDGKDCCHKCYMERKKEHNEYELTVDSCVVTTKTGEIFVVDIEDFDKLYPHYWYFNTEGYVESCINGETIRLHRFLTNCPKGLSVDHDNHFRNDNRSQNLVICTTQENNLNRKAYKKNKYNGVKGVQLTQSGKYSVIIRSHKKTYCLGTFDTLKEAADAYDKAAIELHGKFAHLNNYQEEAI